MVRGVTLSLGEFYHIYNRGTDKRLVFQTDRDYKRFQALLYLCNQSASIQYKLRGLTSDIFNQVRKPEIVDIAAYCLMPNHFHLLIHERIENGISAFMQKLTTAYTMYFNRRYDRTGALFQGTFKAEHVADDVYLKYLLSYIHLNPIKLIDPLWRENGISDKEKAENYLDSYQYSSYLDYCGIKRPQCNILNINCLPVHFETKEDFKGNVLEWLTY